MELLHKELTDRILRIYYDVYNELGYGFLEKVYQNAMFHALISDGLTVEAQKQIKVYFRGKEVGEYFADLVVEGKIIIELKATEYIVSDFEHQLINYLRGTRQEVGLLLNFGKKPEFKRKIFHNHLKNPR
ncbi:MAG: GxxExxY protein [Saprospiraceae bacterium]|nr:GxxExxY protein [Saprospiraceae bacterium]